MATLPAPSLLPPAAVITDSDKGGVALIVTALGLAFALVSALIRIYVRYEFSPNRFRWDDGIIGIAFFFSIFQSATIFVEVHYGFGKVKHDIAPRDLLAIQKASYADDILWITSLWLSKVSVGTLFLRLSPKSSHVLVSQLNILFAILTGTIAILIVCLRCDLSNPWIDINARNAQCSDLFARWQTVAAFDISLEILLFATSVFLIYSLQMTLLKKLMISLAFALRLPVIIPAAFHLHYLSDTLNSSDPTLVGVYALACRQSELAWAITAATIPCLRPFITATATNYGAPAEGPRTKTGTYGVHGGRQSANKLSRSRSGQNPLASLTLSLRPHKRIRSSSFPGGSVFENQYVNNRAQASRHAGSIESGESQQMIILKNMSYKVERED